MDGRVAWKSAIASSGVDSSAFWSQVVELASAMIDAKRVWLFGSRAMGGFRRNSDIDLAFERGSASSKDFDAFWARLSDEAEILLPLDLVDLDTCQSELRKAILAHGKVVYERD